MSLRDKKAIVGEMLELIKTLDEAGGVAELCPQCGEIHLEKGNYCRLCGAGLEPPKRPGVKVKRILEEI